LGYQRFSHMSHSFNVFFCCLLFCLTRQLIMYFQMSFYIQTGPFHSSMASSGAVSFWRAAGMTYITYSNICANLVRNCLKEPHKTEALSREKVHFALAKWGDGKPGKASTFPFLSFFFFHHIISNLVTILFHFIS